MTISMPLLLPVVLATGQIVVDDSAALSGKVQVAAITATVQIRNAAQKTEGSGALIGKSGPFVYILTAQHVVQGARGLEVAVFSEDSYPNPKAVYRSAAVIAEMPGLADLALVRLSTADKMPSMLRVCPERLMPMEAELSMLAIGCDAGKAPSGFLEKTRKKLARRPDGTETVTFWEVARKPTLGRSGGPLVDGRGYVLGVCSGGANKEMSYFIHIVEVHRFLIRHGFRWLIEEKE